MLFWSAPCPHRTPNTTRYIPQIFGDALRSGRLRHLAASPSLPLGTLWISRTEGPSRLPLVREVFDSLWGFAREDGHFMSQID